MDKQSGAPEEQPIRIPVKDKRKVHAADRVEATDVTVEAGEAGEAGEAQPGAGFDHKEASELQVAKQEAAGYLEDLQRLKAEFENYRKRILKEQSAFVQSASVLLISRLLGALDSFSLAISSAEELSDPAVTLKGVEMAYSELMEVLKSEGLEKLEPQGELFDPNLHEAAVEVPGDDSGVLKIDEVLRPGYAFKGRVLRPPMVKVTQRGDEHQEG